MKNIKAVTGFGMLLAMSSVGFAAPKSQIYQPKPGGAERKAIFNALRPPVQRVVGKKVIFQGTLKASRSGWAFFSGAALLSNGKPISDEGSGGEMGALLQLRGGKWRVMSWGFGGGTDAVDEAKAKYPQAPVGIFPF